MTDLGLADVLSTPAVAVHAFDLDVLEQLSASKHNRQADDVSDPDEPDAEVDDSWYANFDINIIDELNSAKLQDNTKGNFGSISVDDGNGTQNVLVSSGLYDDDEIFDEDGTYFEGTYEQDDSEQINIDDEKEELIKKGHVMMHEMEVDTDTYFTTSSESESYSDNDSAYGYDFDLADMSTAEKGDKPASKDQYYNDNANNEQPVDDYFATGSGIKNAKIDDTKKRVKHNSASTHKSSFSAKAGKTILTKKIVHVGNNGSGRTNITGRKYKDNKNKHASYKDLPTNIDNDPTGSDDEQEFDIYKQDNPARGKSLLDEKDLKKKFNRYKTLNRNSNNKTTRINDDVLNLLAKT